MAGIRKLRDPDPPVTLQESGEHVLESAEVGAILEAKPQLGHFPRGAPRKAKSPPGDAFHMASFILPLALWCLAPWINE